MEIPEKIYVTECMLFATNPEITLPKNGNIEYIRTDAFIEKACEWIRKNWREYINVDKDGVVCFGHWKKDFKKYMEE